MIDIINSGHNFVLDFQFIRIFILLITGVFVGYTLQPVPSWLNNLFDTSVIFKFFILYLVGCVSLYPLKDYTILHIFGGSLLVLIVFELSRRIDKKDKKN